MKKLVSLILTACMLLTLAACSGSVEETTPATTGTEAEVAKSTDTTDAAEVSLTSYTYVFQGMMGEETAQIDLYDDGTCQFFLPGNPMITDVYAGTYTREGDAVSVLGLTNVDTSSSYTTPGLWDWIVDGNASVTVDDAAETFVPVGGGDISGETATAETEGNKNVSYASNSDAQVCDIYVPENADNCPVIVLVHGGGFLFGDQGMSIIQPVIAKALEMDYAVVSVDYRKSSEAVFPAALADVKAAVRFVKAHAMDYGWNPEKITVWGESAGAYLSLMTALTPDVPELNGDVADYSDTPNDVQALVSFYAPVEFYTMYEEAGKPDSASGSFESKFLGQDILADREATYKTYWETYADKLPADLKAWIQAGDADARVPYTQSANFAERLVGYIGEENVEYSLIPGADHEDELFYTDENLDAVFAWLDGIMKG
ncbi:MAG: alpha/beta fold hydrolase [Faecousia sp.]